MKLRIHRETFIRGVPVQVGQVVDVDAAEGRLLVGYGLASPYADPAPAEAPQPQPAKAESDAKKPGGTRRAH